MNIDQSIPELTFGPITRAMLALYAGASGDHNPIHIDSDYAAASGQPDVFAHGMLSFGVLAQTVTEWAGQDSLLSLNVRFMSVTHVHDVVTCSGTIVERFEEDGHKRLRVALRAIVHDGRTTLEGEAVVRNKAGPISRHSDGDSK